MLFKQWVEKQYNIRFRIKQFSTLLQFRNRILHSESYLFLLNNRQCWRRRLRKRQQTEGKNFISKQIESSLYIRFNKINKIKTYKKHNLSCSILFSNYDWLIYWILKILYLLECYYILCIIMSTTISKRW